MDNADYQGDEVNDEAVKDGDKIHFDASPDNTGREISVYLDIVGRLHEAQECPEDTYDQGADADFLDPAGSLPGSEEEADEKKCDDDHSNGTAGNEEVEEVC